MLKRPYHQSTTIVIPVVPKEVALVLVLVRGPCPAVAGTTRAHHTDIVHARVVLSAAAIVIAEAEVLLIHVAEVVRALVAEDAAMMTIDATSVVPTRLLPVRAMLHLRAPFLHVRLQQPMASMGVAVGQTLVPG